ncbi:hypothetical protein CCACVL1_03881 [Corchorus capsularis]|uniref:peptidylprolyl isomerase n=1 Tax=Corchorus capsularis TaxID=210143 RepID=A0A1R3JWK3_COCAP|nr:hypothetical protein CCACVL1_03881 [Corchorus capsularis]
MAFFGIEVKPGKPFIHHPLNSRLHLSQATLGNGSAIKKSIVQCNLGNKSPVFLCCLYPDKTECCQLNLEFEEAHKVVFSVIGPRSVHLTGYYVSRNHPNAESEESYGEDIGDTETERSENSEESEYGGSFINDDDPETIPSSPDSSAQRNEDMLDLKKSNDGKKTWRRLRKKYQLISESENDNSSLRKVSAAAVEEVSDSEVEDALTISSLFREETDKRNGNDTEDNVAVLEGTNAAIDIQPESESDLRNHEKQNLVLGNHNGMPKKSEEVKKEETFREADHGMIGLEKNQKLDNEWVIFIYLKRFVEGNPQQNLLLASTQVGLEDGAKLKRKRKVQVGEKTLKGNVAKEDKGEKNVSNTDAVMEDGHVENKETQEQVSEKKRKKKKLCGNEDDGDTRKIIELSNGVIIEDIKVGKPDGKVRFHYTGKLKETGQEFGSTAGKAPLKYRLGGEEEDEDEDVWNLGVDVFSGMRVGGIRRLTLPPWVSYRNKGACKIIPPNSWLVFEVELVQVGVDIAIINNIDLTRWKKTLEMAQNLCEIQAKQNFPTSKEIACLDEKYLRDDCKLGYRAKAILQLAKKIETRKLDKLINKLEDQSSDITSYQESYEKLKDIKGFGDFVCSNIMMCIGYYEKIPSDSETIRHLKMVHNKENCSSETIKKDVEEIFGMYAPFQCMAYWMELVKEYENRFGKLSELDSSSYHLVTGNGMRNPEN